jgi:hypothetical protein
LVLMTQPVPSPGKKLNWKWLALGGVAAVAGVYWYSKKAKAAISPTPSDSTDSGLVATDTGDYGSGSDYSAYGVGGYGVGGYPPGYTYPGAPISVPATNAIWAQQAKQLLVNDGYDAITVDAALGRYLSGQTLTDAQLSIVWAAIAQEGYPPQAVPPPHTAPPSGQPPATTRLATPHLGYSGGGRIGARVVLSWTAVPHATRYLVYRNGILNHTTTGTSYIYTEKNRGVNWAVEAYATNFYRSLRSNVVTVP